jgi:hypothetical protein
MQVAEGEHHEFQSFAVFLAEHSDFEFVVPQASRLSEKLYRWCAIKPPLRTKSVGTKVSEAEFAVLEEHARVNRLTLSEWVREVLLSAPAAKGIDASEVALAELLALRSLFLNLQFRTAGQSPLTEAEVRGLIERADATKMLRARERLEALRAESSKKAGETQTEES